MSYLDFLDFWQLPKSLVEDISDLNKPKGAKPGGSKPPTPPPGGTEAPGAGEAMMMQQKMDAAKERMEFDQNQKVMKQQAKEIEAEQDLLIKAEQAVADDLNDQYSDKDDKVEFYPQFESFRTFVGRALSEESKCVVCGKTFDPSASGDKDFCVDDLDQKRD